MKKTKEEMFRERIAVASYHLESGDYQTAQNFGVYALHLASGNPEWMTEAKNLLNNTQTEENTKNKQNMENIWGNFDESPLERPYILLKEFMDMLTEATNGKIEHSIIVNNELRKEFRCGNVFDVSVYPKKDADKKEFIMRLILNTNLPYPIRIHTGDEMRCIVSNEEELNNVFLRIAKNEKVRYKICELLQ